MARLRDFMDYARSRHCRSTVPWLGTQWPAKAHVARLKEHLVDFRRCAIFVLEPRIIGCG